MKRTTWTKERDDFLNKYYHAEGGLYCMAHLSISRSSLEHRVARLGLTESKAWRPEEDAIMNQYYIDEGCAFCVAKLNRTTPAVHGRAKVLGLNKLPNKKHFRWNKTFEQVLIDDYHRNGPEYCAKILNLSLRQIYSKAESLKLEERLIIPQNGFLFCYKCKNEKPQKEFFANKKFKFSYRCKSCLKIERDEKKSKSPFRPWARGTIRGHLERGFTIKFSINELIKIAEKVTKCPFCKKEICWMKSKTKPDSPTLDRLENNQDLTLKNIDIICHECNCVKKNRTVNEYRNFLKKSYPNLDDYAEKYYFSVSGTDGLDYQI